MDKLILKYIEYKRRYQLTRNPKIFKSIDKEKFHNVIDNTPLFFDIFEDDKLLEEYIPDIIDIFSNMKCNGNCHKCFLYMDKLIYIFDIFKDYYVKDFLIEKLNNNFIVNRCLKISIYVLVNIPKEFINLIETEILIESMSKIVSVWLKEIIQWYEITGSELCIVDKKTKKEYIVDKDTPFDTLEYDIKPVLDILLFNHIRIFIKTIFKDWLDDIQAKNEIINIIKKNKKRFKKYLVIDISKNIYLTDHVIIENIIHDICDVVIC